jgi:hypothetical protein
MRLARCSSRSVARRLLSSERVFFQFHFLEQQIGDQASQARILKPELGNSLTLINLFLVRRCCLAPSVQGHHTYPQCDYPTL